MVPLSQGGDGAVSETPLQMAAEIYKLSRLYSTEKTNHRGSDLKKTCPRGSIRLYRLIQHPPLGWGGPFRIRGRKGFGVMILGSEAARRRRKILMIF